MIEKMLQKSDGVLGYRVFGKITTDDYAQMLADLDAAGQEATRIQLLLDLEAFDGEETGDQGTKYSIPFDYGAKLAKLAVVGDLKWKQWLLNFAESLRFASEIHFFPVDEHESAWAWLQT